MANSPFRPTRPPIMSYLVKHPYEPVTLDDLVQVTGLSRAQIQAQFRMMIADGIPVRVITRASIWQYEPEEKVEPESDPEPVRVVGQMFEAIGKAKSGAIVLRDENGDMYSANPLDI